jgi:hypothetical protein
MQNRGLAEMIAPVNAPRRRESAKQFKKVVRNRHFAFFFASFFALSRLRGAFLGV